SDVRLVLRAARPAGRSGAADLVRGRRLDPALVAGGGRGLHDSSSVTGLSNWLAAGTRMPRSIIAIRAILLGFALQINDGFYDERALIWLGVAALCCAVATLGLVPAGGLALDGPRVVTGILVAGIVSNILALALTRPGMYLNEPLPSQHPLFLAG